MSIELIIEEKPFQKLRTDLRKKLSVIRLLLINADVFLSEIRFSLYAKNTLPSDGSEIKTLRKLGVKVIAFSTKKSEALDPIINRLGVEILHRNILNKSVFYAELKAEHSVLGNEIAFLGGDFSDLSIIDAVNFPVAAADAPLEVKTKSYYVAYGVGEGAVREVAELILKARNYTESG